MEFMRPSGVGGWLMFFSATSALNILVSFYNYAIAVLIAMRTSSFFEVVLPYCILGIPISLLGAWSVSLLFSRRSSAVSCVKLFLILYALVSLLVSVLAFHFAPADMPPGVARWYATLEFRAVHIVYCAIWFWYFSVSDRVKNTYDVPQAI